MIGRQLKFEQDTGFRADLRADPWLFYMLITIWCVDRHPYVTFSLKRRPEMKPIKLFSLVFVLMFIAAGCEKKPTKSLHDVI